MLGSAPIGNVSLNVLNPGSFTAVPQTSISQTLQNIDARLTRVEQILPTLPTREQMDHAITDAVSPLNARITAEGERTRQQIASLDARIGSLDARISVEEERTRQQVAALDARISANDEQTRHQYASLDQRLSTEAERTVLRFEAVHARITAAERRTRQQIDRLHELVTVEADSARQRAEATDARIAEEGAETRQHFNVVAERLEARIALALEGYVSANERITDVQLASESRDVVLDTRVTQLEATRRPGKR